ncbi:MAG TPA: hypothetical protein VF337_02205, partial [Candidatus Limnocylindrales bacterium]
MTREVAVKSRVLVFSFCLVGALGLAACTLLPSNFGTPGAFSSVGGMETPRCHQSATLLNNGKVLVAGGDGG